MLRVMTYNIRACLGLDGARSPHRIAEVIAEANPSIVALQEVDLLRARSGRIDQASLIAELLQLERISAPSFRDDDGSYGNAILATTPLQLIRHEALPRDAGCEPRAAMWAIAEHPPSGLHVLNTHLSFRRAERTRQIEQLLSPTWLENDALRSRAVLCGDLNCAPRDPAFRRLTDRLADAQLATPGRARTTWPTRRPFRRLDHILVSPDVRVLDAHVIRSRRARMASDHYPLVVDLDL